jgi:hypothetical protein
MGLGWRGWLAIILKLAVPYAVLTFLVGVHLLGYDPWSMLVALGIKAVSALIIVLVVLWLLR